MQNLAGNVNLAGVGQGGQQAQQPTISNIMIGTAQPAAAQRALTGESITRHAQSALKAGNGTFWQIARPTRTLKLTGALNYVNKNFAGRQGADRFVYWPDYRVAGTVNDIVNAFRQAGVQQAQFRGQTGPLTEQNVYNASIDPLNPAHRPLIEQAAAQGAAQGGAQRGPRHSLDEYIQIGMALRAASNQSTTATAGTTTSRGGGGAGRGGRSPAANQQRLVQAFSQLMAQVLAAPPGQDVARVYDVTRYDPSKFTNARLVAPPKSGRATAIRPTININGRAVALPIIAQPSGAPNFQAFLQNVVAQSQYAPIAQAALQAFQSAQQQRAQPVGVQQAQGGFQGGLMGLMGGAQQGQGGFALPQAGAQQAQGGFALPQAGGQAGFALPGQGLGNLPSVGQANTSNIMSQLSAGSRSPTGGARSPMSGAASPAPISVGGLPLTGAQLPQMGGAPSVTGPGGFQLPQVGGGNLPAIGGGQGTGLTGLLNLPSVGQGGGAFGNISLPQVSGGSPNGQ